MRRSLPIRLTVVAVALAFAGGGAAAAAATTPADEPNALGLTPTRPDAAATERMRSWHRQTGERISPVLREWESLARSARQRPGQPLAAGCRRLDRALARLDRDGLSRAPDTAASLHLEKTLRALSEASRSCAQGAWFLTGWRLRQADDSWRELRGRLALYGLVP